MSPKTSFFAELKRRNVYRASVFYAGAAWLLVQIATQTFPFFDIPNWIVRVVVIAVVVGFPFAMLFSWFYEWTPQGIKRESDIAPSESVALQTGKKLDRWIIAVLALAVIVLIADKFVLHKSGTEVADKSIAVLPLVNESGDAKDEYFSDGLSEDLINALTQIKNLRVIGRSSSFQFKGNANDSKSIGAKLGVASLLEGTVRKLGDKLRISASLIRAVDGSQLWSQSYDREYKDIFDIQAEIAQSVAQALKIQLLGDNRPGIAAEDRPPHGNLKAYEDFLQGNFYAARGNRADWRIAISHYQQALDREPDYASALSALSLTWITLGGQLGGKEAADAFASAQTTARQALALSPNLALPHVALGWLLHDGDLNFAAARVEFERAATLAPELGSAQDGLAQVLADFGHLDAAIETERKAVALEPLNSHFRDYLGLFLIGAGRLDEAEGALRKALELQPGLYAAHARLATIALLRGDANAALREAQLGTDEGWLHYGVALALSAGNDTPAADAALKTLIDADADASAFQIANVYAFRKQPDKAFEWLDRALTNRDSGLAMLNVYPFFDSLQSDPRFAAFCKKIGLPEPARTR